MPQSFRIIIIAIIAGCAGLWVGSWFFPHTSVSPSFKNAVREGGYALINPILTCNPDGANPPDQNVQQVIQNAVDTEVANGNILTASVYYRRFLTTSWATVNATDTFYPASLNKVPLMIAYYNWVEESDFPLTQTLYLPPGNDQNAQQEIPPPHPLALGKSYTADQLINAMIKESDNNATLVLLNAIDDSTLQKVFTDLNVPFLAEGQAPTNYMTVSSFALFFRVLYNGTYLSHTDSERALEVLSQTDFNDGLVAGVPPGTTVAHKFGLVSVAPNNTVVTARELHDCGIIYPSSSQATSTSGNEPYLLCVMTKSTGSLQGAEQAIADISRAVYQYVVK